MTTPRKPGEAHPAVQLGILLAILALLANAGFYFLSDAYFADRAKKLGVQELARLPGARTEFAVFSIVIAAGVFAAGLRARAVGHGLAALLGLGAVIAGLAGIGSLPVVLVICLLLTGVALGALAHRSYHARSRPAWACLSSLCLVGGIVTLFGAPKLRTSLETGLWIALIIPGMLAVATWALAQVRADYRES